MKKMSPSAPVLMGSLLLEMIYQKLFCLKLFGPDK